jgi:hypothetical protein
VIVQRAKRVRNVEAMVPRVNVSIQKFVHVHIPMHEVLPSVDDEPRPFIQHEEQGWREGRT